MGTMLTLEESKKIVLEKLANNGLDELTIFDKHIIEGDDYFAFSCNSKKFFETGDYSHMIIGGTYIIIDRNNGDVYRTATAKPIEYYIDLFKKKIADTVT